MLTWLPGRRRLVCRQAVELVTDYLEGTLSQRDRRRFEEHLAQCPHCTEYLRQIRTTIAAAGKVEPEALSPEAQQALIGLYREWRRT